MSKLPIPHIINTIKTKLGFDRTMTAPGDDVVDAVNKQSQQIENIEGSIAIIVDGDTASQAVPAEGYAYIKNNTHGLSEGLYKNISGSAFPTSGGTANSTVFRTVSGGGFNKLSDAISLFDLECVTDINKNGNFNLFAYRTGQLLMIYISSSNNTPLPTPVNSVVCTLPSRFNFLAGGFFTCFSIVGNTIAGSLRINKGDNVVRVNNNEALQTGVCSCIITIPISIN